MRFRSHVAAWCRLAADRRSIRQFPEGPPLLVTGGARCGSTWFAAMLSQPGLWSLHEPFNPNRGRTPRSYLYARPSVPNGWLDALACSILSGGERHALHVAHAASPGMPLRLLPPPRQRRTLVKDPNGCLLSAYLTKHHGFRTYVLCRHPGAMASSVTRLAWPTAFFLKAFLKDTPLLDDHLHPYREIIERYSEGGGVESAIALYGCLYRVLVNQAKAHGAMSLLSYEVFARHPLEEFERFFAETGLPYGPALRERHTQLSLRHETGRVYPTHAVERCSVDMVDRWRRDWTPEQMARCRDLWSAFDLPLYRDDDAWRCVGVGQA